MVRKNSLWKKVLFIMLFCLAGYCLADKEPAQVSIEGRAQDKTRTVQVSGRSVLERYWLVEITFRNDENYSVIVHRDDFTIVDSKGRTSRYFDMPGIAQ